MDTNSETQTQGQVSDSFHFISFQGFKLRDSDSGTSLRRRDSVSVRSHAGVGGFYIQAVDMPLNLAAGRNPDTQKLYHAFLHVSSLTKTKRLPAFCLLHVGMQVRLTTTLEMPYAVQDATATVLEIQFADSDEKARGHRRSGAVLESLEPGAGSTLALTSSSCLDQAP